MSEKAKTSEWPAGLTLKMPAGLGLDDQIAFCIGNLVMAWANCESMFYGIFSCIAGKAGTDNAAILWLGTKSTKARVDIALQLIESSEVKDELKAEISHFAKEFDGITRTRNFFCHAYYKVDTVTLALSEAEAFAYDPRLKRYASNSRELSKATINELSDTIRRTVILNRDLWKPFLALRDQLNADHVPLPEPLPEFLRQLGPRPV